ncbi:MAG: glycosyltransferase [Treponema sp.]|nr:glycosyltransferase [Treponema sp.]
MVKVSVVVPIFNIAEKLLRKCIQSIICQTEKDVEVFLVDDGSTNNCLSVCASYASFPNVTVLHQENAGVSAARNAGMNRAAGEWVMFVDPDDYLEPNAIEILLKNAEKDDDVIACCCYKLDADGKRNKCHFYAEDKNFNSYESKKELFENLLYKLTLIGAPWGKLFRMEFLKKHNIRFFLELKRSQDIIFNLYASQFAKNYKYINEALYVYNTEHGNNFHKVYRPELSELYLRFAKARYDWMNHFGYFEDAELKELYYCGACSILFQILEVGPLHPLNGISLKKRKVYADAIQNEECFEILNKMKCCRFVTVSTRQKVMQLLLRHRMYFFLFYWLRFRK